MRFTTETTLPTGSLEITHVTQMMLLGSCFAQNIGEYLRNNKFQVDINPFGIMYNPLSIATALRRIASGEPFEASSPDLFNHNGLWHSFLHHGEFSRKEKADTIEAVNSRLAKAHCEARSLDVLMLTFGTAYVYCRTEDGSVVGNCHKLPSSMFTRRLLTVDEIAEEMSQVIEQYLQLRPSLKILFTVSPIRHLRDGAHDNQVSKATLLLAIEKLRKLFPDNTLYFPSYEIMLDELRDYRYYADDLVHPSTLAVEYLWDSFSRCYFSPHTKALNSEVAEIMRGLSHRPFDATSSGYLKFLSQILLKISEVQKKCPYFDFENEISKCNTLLRG